MKTAGWFFLRAGGMTAGIVLAVALFLQFQNSLTARDLSDGLVYASFLTLAAGTLLGIFNVGYHRRPPLPGEPPEGPFEHALKEFLLARVLGWTVVLSGIFTFLAAVGADLFF